MLIAFYIFAATGAVFSAHFAEGFTHIVPYGLDHMLFLFALFFLNRNFADLLLQLTLFTIAHSLTLGLSPYLSLNIPTTIIEVAIALSITFAALENLRSEKVSRWRPSLVFAAGLVHGLGFAHSFGGASVDRGDFLPALLSYNLGIEAGQITVVGCAWLLTAAWAKRQSYGKIVARPASILIALTGIFWALERAF